MPSTMTKPRSKREAQPRCKGCRHPSSFHGGGRTDCRALGCKCGGWTGSLLGADDQSFIKRGLTIAQKAKRLGRSERWVREHADELGGRQLQSHVGKKPVWYFPA